MTTQSKIRWPAWQQLLAVLSALTVFTSGCALTGTGVACRAGEQSAVMDSLYFGTATSNGRVAHDDWQLFLGEVITPRFPDGLTAWAAAGQWRNPAGELQKEDSYVLHVVHPDEPRYETAVREVIDVYKTRFQQQAVLRVRTPTCISF